MKLKVTWTKSAIGHNKRQKATVRALGLRHLHHSVIHEDTPAMRGMLHAVRHLVMVEALDEAQLAEVRGKRPEARGVVIRPPAEVQGAESGASAVGEAEQERAAAAGEAEPRLHEADAAAEAPTAEVTAGAAAAGTAVDAGAAAPEKAPTKPRAKAKAQAEPAEPVEVEAKPKAPRRAASKAKVPDANPLPEEEGTQEGKEA
ncbi:MAG: 50S ribosomal protein L30 [Chloroflexota bacterium]|nr:50S ribosomal protein L30 [Chloroflexota bacterium]